MLSVCGSIDFEVALPPKRVLVLAPDFPPERGGIQVVVDRLIQNWTRLDILTLAGKADGSREIDEDLPCRVQRIGPLDKHRVMVAHLNARALAAAASFKPDVVLSTHIVSCPGAIAVKRLLGVPYVQYVYGKEVAERQALARTACANAQATISISAFTEELLRKVGATKAHVYRIPPGVDADKIELNGRRSGALVVTVARLADRYKGHDVMIRALPLIKARRSDVEWIVIGDGPLRKIYEEMVRCVGIASTVRFVGTVDDAERDRWLNQAQVFAMPSRVMTSGAGEGFGIAYLEAGRHGVPVVAGDVGGATDAVIDGATGTLVDPNNHVAVADAISDLLLNPDKASRYGKAGALRAQEFAWPSVARRVEDLLLEVVSARAA